MASQITGYIGQINPGNGINYSIGSTVYGECNTAAATAAKTVDMTGFTLIKGATIYVKFINANTASSPTLNVQGTGAKPIILNNFTTMYWPANTLIGLTYDGTNWVTNDLIDYNNFLQIKPKGGYYNNNKTSDNSIDVGAIKITLPVPANSNNNAMLNFLVVIYHYNSKDYVTYYISGYPFENTWHPDRCNAYSISNVINSRTNATVRYGNDGTNLCITIGEENTSWKWSLIYITNVYVGYTNITQEKYKNYMDGDWNISFSSTDPVLSTIDYTIENPNILTSITNAINNLDVSNISGFGKGRTLSALSETNGKISATFLDIEITTSQVSDFPSSMPASDVSAWAKAANKPSYSLSEITSASDILAIEVLTGTSGFLKKTAANKWELDTTTYVTSSGVTSITLKAGTGISLDTDNTAITTSGTRTISLADKYGDTKNPYGTKNQKLVLATPSNTSGVPSFRALVENDIPDLNASKINAGTLDFDRLPTMYWANVAISNTSATNKSPTFGTVTINNGANISSTLSVKSGYFYLYPFSSSYNTNGGTAARALIYYNYDNSNRINNTIYSNANLSVPGIYTTGNSNSEIKGQLTINTMIVNGNSLFNNNVNFNSLPTIGNLTLLSALGLSNALHFIGKATNVITDGGNQDPGIDNYSTRLPGDIIIDKDNIYEYVYTKANTWERLGPDGNYKQIQSNSVSYSTSTTNSWISGILQNINGDITSATYSTLDTSGNWTGSAAQLTNSRKLKVALNSTTDVSFNGSADVTNIPISGTLDVGHGGTGATTFTSGYLLTGNGSNSILAYQPSWEAWTTGNTAGPKANIKLGNITYESSSIPIASDTQSGVVTTSNLTFKGTKTFYNETTTNDDDYASILFTIKDSTIPSNKTQSASSTIRVYSDHRQEGSAGTNFVLQSGGNTIIGSGEAGLTYYNKIAKTINDDSTQNNVIGKWNNTSENFYLLADTSLYLEANNNIPSGETNPINRAGIMITTGGNIIPVAQELNNPGVLSLGNTDAAWKNLYLTNSIVSTTKNLSITLNNDTTKIWIYDNTTTATYNGRNITPSLYVSGTGYFDGAVEASTNFINNVNTTGGGFYIKSQDVEYGRLYVNTLGTTTTTGVARLILGNATATGNIGNALGSIYLYSSSGTYVNILNSNTTTSVLVKIPNYSGHMVLAHVGNTNNAIGSSTSPVYVEGNGKISVGSTYAGGTKVILNGTDDRGATTASFYAPTSSGTSGTQALVSSGTNTAPIWTNITPSVNLTDGTSTNAPKLKITVLGLTASTAVELTKASTTVYGVTKLSSVINTNDNVAATPAAVKAAMLASAYAGSILTTSAATYNTEPEVKSIKITGNTNANTTATTGVVLQYDATLKVLNFVFA